MRISYVKRGDRDVESRNDCSVAIEKLESNAVHGPDGHDTGRDTHAARYQIVGTWVKRRPIRERFSRVETSPAFRPILK